MAGLARCSTCFRVERREGDAVLEVVMPGGGRKPALPADLAAWRAWRDVKDGFTEAPVARCESCGQPMFKTEGELPAMQRWEFTLPDGVIAVGGNGVVLDGDDAAADQRIEAFYQDKHEPKLTNGQFGFALVLAVLGFAIAAVVGVCECPTMAMAVAVPLGARAAAEAARSQGRSGGKRRS
jgi:hypothetical protein